MLINPSNPSDTSCRAESFIVYDQTFTATADIVYGEANDETQTRVRIGTTLSSGTHRARVAKAVGAGCATVSGPISTITTSFAGKHTALVDRASNPSCVFQSMLGFAGYNQTLDVGLPLDVSAQTSAAVQAQLLLQMDLEVAMSANAYHHSETVPDGAYIQRSGRCADSYQTFTGP